MSDQTPICDELVTPLLDVLQLHREISGGDIEKMILILAIAERTVRHPDFKTTSNLQRLGDELPVFPNFGVNSRSIADSTGVPRETVRRKVAELVAHGWVAQAGRNLHLTADAYRTLNPGRESVERLAEQFTSIVERRRPGLAEAPAAPFAGRLPVADDQPPLSDDLVAPFLDLLQVLRDVCAGDIEKIILMLVVAERTVRHPAVKALSTAERMDSTLAVLPNIGVNARSIADSTGIPRETVRRKVADLVTAGWIAHSGRNLHFTATGYAALTPGRAALERLAEQFTAIVERRRAETVK